MNLKSIRFLIHSISQQMTMFLIEKNKSSYYDFDKLLVVHCVELDFDDGNGSTCIICYVEVIIIILLHAT